MAYEDWNGYTKVDGSTSTITRTGTPCNHIDFVSNRSEDAALYKDYGIGHFSGDFTHLIEVTNVSTGYSYANADIWVLRNDTPPVYGNVTGQASPRVRIYLNKFYLTYYDGSANTHDYADFTVVNGTKYYLTIARSGTTITVTIRTGSHTGPVSDTLTLTTNSTAYRYMYSARVRNTGDNWQRELDIDNLDLQEVVSPSAFMKPEKRW